MWHNVGVLQKYRNKPRESIHKNTPSFRWKKYHALDMWKIGDLVMYYSEINIPFLAMKGEFLIPWSNIIITYTPNMVITFVHQGSKS